MATLKKVHKKTLELLFDGVCLVVLIHGVTSPSSAFADYNEKCPQRGTVQQRLR